MGSSVVSFSSHAVACAFAITTESFDKIEDNYQTLWCAKGVLDALKVVEKQWTGTGAFKRQIPLLKPKREINKYYKYTKYNENKLLTERAAISQKVATQQPKLN